MVDHLPQNEADKLLADVVKNAPDEMKPYLGWLTHMRPIHDATLSKKGVLLTFPPRDDLESEKIEYMWQFSRSKFAVRAIHVAEDGGHDLVVKEEFHCHITCMFVRLFEAMSAHTNVLQSIAAEPRPNPKSPWAKE